MYNEPQIPSTDLILRLYSIVSHRLLDIESMPIAKDPSEWKITPGYSFADSGKFYKNINTQNSSLNKDFEYKVESAFKVDLQETESLSDDGADRNEILLSAFRSENDPIYNEFFFEGFETLFHHTATCKMDLGSHIGPASSFYFLLKDIESGKLYGLIKKAHGEDMDAIFMKDLNIMVPDSEPYEATYQFASVAYREALENKDDVGMVKLLGELNSRKIVDPMKLILDNTHLLSGSQLWMMAAGIRSADHESNPDHLISHLPGSLHNIRVKSRVGDMNRTITDGHIHEISYQASRGSRGDSHEFKGMVITDIIGTPNQDTKKTWGTLMRNKQVLDLIKVASSQLEMKRLKDGSLSNELSFRMRDEKASKTKGATI